jgi:hypothetical protein
MIPNYLRSAAVLRRGTQEFQALQRRIDRSGAGSPLLIVPIQRTLTASPTVSSPIQSGMAHTGINSFGFPLKKCFDEICADDASPQQLDQPTELHSYCVSPLSDTATIQEAFGPDVVAVLNGTSEKDSPAPEGGVSHVCSTPPDDSSQDVAVHASESVATPHRPEVSAQTDVISRRGSVDEFCEGDFDGFIPVVSKKQAAGSAKSAAKNHVGRHDKSTKRHRDTTIRPQAPTRILQAPRPRAAASPQKASSSATAAPHEPESSNASGAAVTTRLNAAAAAWYPPQHEEQPEFTVEQLGIPMFPPELLLQAAMAYAPMQAMLSPVPGGLPAFPYHLLPMMLHPQVMGPMVNGMMAEDAIDPPSTNVTQSRAPSVTRTTHPRPASTTRKPAPFARGAQSIKILARPTQ